MAVSPEDAEKGRPYKPRLSEKIPATKLKKGGVLSVTEKDSNATARGELLGGGENQSKMVYQRENLSSVSSASDS